MRMTIKAALAPAGLPVRRKQWRAVTLYEGEGFRGDAFTAKEPFRISTDRIQ